MLLTTLPTGDRTPSGYILPVTGRLEIVKGLFRRFFYPVYNAFNHLFLAHHYASPDFQPDLWLWGQRGNDYERHRRRVAKFSPLNGRHVLVAGCGTARDVESWVQQNPQRIVGIDWFSYDSAWGHWKQRFNQIAPGVEVQFAQADLACMSEFSDASFDVVSSDAVFEHLKNLPEVLAEFHRILRPGGLLYATFGPLWFGWGGDHVSGYDSITSGYNHLILDQTAYRIYLNGVGKHTHSEHDGRTWIEHDLFSRLTPRQYLNYLNMAGFKRRFVSAMIDPKAAACLRHRQFDMTALDRFDELDLLVCGMTIIYER